MQRTLLPCLGLLLFACGGCGTSANQGPFGPADDSPLIAPFAGNWTIDADKTFDAMRAAGANNEDVSKLRKFYADNPQFGGLHADLQFDGTVAITPPPLSQEYRFFALHKHGDKICGKAWHHEDRYDPGDMNKCYVRLWGADGVLHLQVRMKDGLPDLDDPDKDMPTEIPAENCEVDHPRGEGWGEWTTYVFRRK